MSIPGPILGIISSVIGGIGQGMMERSRMRAEEQRDINEERRAEERYRGVGDAMAFWDNLGVDPDASVASPYTNPHKKETTPLGQPEKPPQVGQQYKKKKPPQGFNGMVPT